MAADYDFDIALSFAGERRPYVNEVAAGLRDRGFRVFYDQFNRAELLGQDLITYLQDIYGRRSATVAAFISEEWVARPWPTHERQTVLAHALLESRAEGAPMLLPFRFDDTPVPGLHASVAYEDLRVLQPGERRWTEDDRYKHPKYATSLLTHVLAQRGLGPPDLDLEKVDTEPVILVHLIWIEEGTPRHIVGPIPLEEFERGEVRFSAGETQAGGPATGRYLRLSDDYSAAINPNDRFPVLLIDTHEAKEKSWTVPLTHPSQEVQVVDQVRRQVQQAVEIEIQEGAVPLGPTFTSTHDTPYGPGVRGICVLGTSHLSEMSPLCASFAMSPDALLQQRPSFRSP